MFKNLSFIALLLLVIGCTPEPNEAISPRPEALSTVEAVEFSSSMLTKVNTIRTQGCTCGSTQMPAVDPLTWNEKLTDAADRHAYDMNTTKFFDHKGSDNSQVGDRSSEAGYAWMAIGENIALADLDMDGIIEGWLKSTPHCKQLMSDEYKDLGAAQRDSYWVQVFGRSVEN